jgi:hypothetical protein
MITQIEQAIKNAENNTSLLSQDILNSSGASGLKGRHLHNNLSRIFNQDLSYLEIGTQRGLSFCTALSDINYKYACVIDNWIEGDFRDIFNTNINKFLPNKKFDVYDQDCWTIELNSQIKEKINFYFYDGWHAKEAQEKAFTYYNDVLEDTFLCMVDDWNCPNVREGTKDAFKKLKYNLLYEKDLFTENFNNRIGAGAGNPNTWWNGLYIALIKK